MWTRRVIHVDQCSETIAEVWPYAILCSATRETQVDFLADYMQGCLSSLLTEQSRQFCIQMYLTQ